MPKVSVIVPNYNYAVYLDQRLQSILRQTYQDFELIILDDKSTDNSESIIECYRCHPKVTHIVYNEENSGSVFRQWDKGINLAKGEYIWIAESDDWCEPTFLEYLVEGLEKNPACVLAYCQSYMIENSNSITRQTRSRFLSEVKDGRHFIEEHLLYGCTIINASMAVWKRQIFPQITQDFLNYKFSGDWAFWVELCARGDVFVSGRALNYFRKSGRSVSDMAYNSGLNFIDNLQILNKLYRSSLVSRKQYFRAWKLKHREYWLKKRSLNPALLPEIQELFYHPIVGGLSKGFLVYDGIMKKVRFEIKSFFRQFR